MTKDGKRALVLGISGGIGGAVARALIGQGWQVRGLARDVAAARLRLGETAAAIEWRQGDAMNRDDIVTAAAGVSALVHAVNPPGYRNWDTLVLPMLDNSIAAARAAGGARIVLPGTVYNYDPARKSLIASDTPPSPTGRKGRIRVEMERRLEAASAEAPALIVRAGDFFGPDAGQGWFSQAMIAPGKPVRRIRALGTPGVGHTWAYLPDIAAAIARLLDRSAQLAAFEDLPFAGHWDSDGHGMVDAIRRVAGNPALRTSAFPWWLLQLAAPFGGFPREAIEVRPYWQHAVRMDNRRLVALLGTEPHTPIDAAVGTALRDMACV